MRLTSCDGPDCTNIAFDSTGDEDEEPQAEWLRIEAYDDNDCGDFCSWECLAAYSMSHALGVEQS